ncbi:MAG: flavin reductase family protein [Myxococcota bacterium]
MPTDADSFKSALSCWASGVTVVTVAEGGLWYGLTVSSFTSVSLEPPLVSICLKSENRASQTIDTTQRFAVSILGVEQAEASNAFATPGREPAPDFGPIPATLTQDGLPVLSGAVAWLQCRVHRRVDAGDHIVWIGEVEQAESTGRPPLLYHARAYRRLDDL